MAQIAVPICLAAGALITATWFQSWPPTRWTGSIPSRFQTTATYHRNSDPQLASAPAAQANSFLVSTRGVQQSIPLGQPQASADKNKPTTLAEVAPEIARSLEMIDQHIAENPSAIEADVQTFLRGLYTVRDDRTAGGTLAESNPELLLKLLSDLWQRIEESSETKLPATPSIEIQNNSRKFDLTETYVQLFSKAVSSGPVDDKSLAELSKHPDVTKLLKHFASSDDPSTPANSLTFGRMIFNIRRGSQPLLDAAQQAPPVAIGDLPKLDRNVDLGGFASVQELVTWAHELKPDEKNPYKVESKADSKTITDRANAYLNLPVEALLPYPGATELMGKIANDAPRVDREIEINLAQPNWQATGLYAPPGEAITFRIPARLRNKGLKVRIGAHTDNIALPGIEGAKTLKRFPVVASTFPLDEARVTVGNPFGGGIYIDVPVGKNGGDLRVPAHGVIIRNYQQIPSPDLQSLAIGGAVEMPWWHPGMSLADFKKELTKPAPWTEMDFGTIAMYVPTDEAKKVKNPQALTDFWQTVMQAEWNFGGYTGQRLAPMRVSFDRQISVGYMHSGYPIMAFTPQASEALDLKTLSEKGNWGLFHEIGHNHQPLCITPDGFVESTVNLFTLSAQVAILPKRDPKLGHDALSNPADLLKRRRAGETSDPWVNLAVFLPLIDEFGMDSLTRTFRSYWQQDAKSGDAPRYPSAEIQDHFALRFGQTVQRDVCDYFESVHFNVTPATRKQLSEFAPWMP